MISALLSALWLGILMSIAPCSMATNIATISFMGKNVQSPIKSLLLGTFYTFGRMFVYVLLGVIIVGGMFSIPVISDFLEKYIHGLIGPFMILIGIFLLDVIKIHLPHRSANHEITEKLSESGIWGAFSLGVIFSSCICPISAGLFFGGLIPLALGYNSKFLVPLTYGIGTSLPIIIFSVIIAFSASKIGGIYQKMTKFEPKLRKATGIVFIFTGIYLFFDHYLEHLL